MYLVFLGPPGVGKGTQAKRASGDYGVVHVSTGDVLRDNVRAGTPAGLEAKPYMESGRLAPDALIVRVTMDRIRQPDCARGVLLDGFPRTIAQAIAIDQALSEARLRLTAACFFNAPDDVLIERMSGRRSCGQCRAGYHVRTLPPKVEGVCDVCYGQLIQREDDKPEVIAQRIQVYRAQSAPVVDHYRKQGILCEVDSTGTVEEIYRRLSDGLAKLAPEVVAVRRPETEPAPSTPRPQPPTGLLVLRASTSSLLRSGGVRPAPVVPPEPPRPAEPVAPVEKKEPGTAPGKPRERKTSAAPAVRKLPTNGKTGGRKGPTTPPAHGDRGPSTGRGTGKSSPTNPRAAGGPNKRKRTP